MNSLPLNWLLDFGLVAYTRHRSAGKQLF